MAAQAALKIQGCSGTSAGDPLLWPQELLFLKVWHLLKRNAEPKIISAKVRRVCLGQTDKDAEAHYSDLKGHVFFLEHMFFVRLWRITCQPFFGFRCFSCNKYSTLGLQLSPGLVFSESPLNGMTIPPSNQMLLVDQPETPEVVGILLQLPLTELQQLVAVPKKFQERLHEALAVVGGASPVGWAIGDICLQSLGENFLIFLVGFSIAWLCKSLRNRYLSSNSSLIDIDQLDVVLLNPRIFPPSPGVDHSRDGWWDGWFFASPHYIYTHTISMYIYIYICIVCICIVCIWLVYIHYRDICIYIYM